MKILIEKRAMNHSDHLSFPSDIQVLGICISSKKENFFNLYVLPKETKNEFPMKT